MVVQTLGPLKVDLMDKIRRTTRSFDNLGMPVSVYKGFEDISPFSARMFREYGSRFVLGELPMSKWDEHVKERYDKGGERWQGGSRWAARIEEGSEL